MDAHSDEAKDKYPRPEDATGPYGHPSLRPGAFLIDALYQAVSLFRSYSGNAYGAGADQQAEELRRLASDLQALAERRRREIEGPPWEP